jgi:surface antigen
MATVAEFLSNLSGFIGTTEAPPKSNHNPFSLTLGRPAEAWCADFVAACARGVSLKLPSESAYTPTMADAFRRAGRWTTANPQPGYVAFWDFPGDNTFGIQHVSVVESVPSPTTVASLEGNTSSGAIGSQDNGGGVFRRVRPAAWAVGYGMPAYDEAPATLGSGVLLPDEEHEMAMVVTRPQGGYIVIAHDGGVFTFDGAPFHGSIPGRPDIKLGGNIVGGAWTQSGEGYWLTARDGGLYAFGDAVYPGQAFNTESDEARGRRYVIGILRTGPQAIRQITFDPGDDGSPYDGYDYATTP